MKKNILNNIIEGSKEESGVEASLPEAVIEAAEFAGHSDPSVTIQNYFNAEISNNFERLRTNDRLSRFLDAQ